MLNKREICVKRGKELYSTGSPCRKLVVFTWLCKSQNRKGLLSFTDKYMAPSGAVGGAIGGKDGVVWCGGISASSWLLSAF